MNPWITWGPVSLLLIEFLVSICLLVVFTAWGRERAVRYYSASLGLAVGVLTLSLLPIARCCWEPTPGTSTQPTRKAPTLFSPSAPTCSPARPENLAARACQTLGWPRCWPLAASWAKEPDSPAEDAGRAREPG